jgi:hypothetical protein
MTAVKQKWVANEGRNHIMVAGSRRPASVWYSGDSNGWESHNNKTHLLVTKHWKR